MKPATFLFLNSVPKNRIEKFLENEVDEGNALVSSINEMSSWHP